MEELLNTEIWNGKSIADYLTLDMMVSVIGSIASAIAILVIALLVSGWISRRIRSIGENHAKLDDTLFNFLSNIARYVVMAFAVLFVLNTFGIQTTSMVAAIGAAGLAIGLALQGTLSNVAAGVMLILFRPIKVGDFVEINDKSGTVKDITLNFVEMASLSNTQVIVPNSEVWGNTITNYSVYPTRRAEWTFGVGYGVNLAKAEEVIRNTILADERAHSEPEPFIQVTNLGGSSVDFLVRVWCDRTEYFAFRADMTRKVKEALDEADINIPFPTRTIITERA
ncbi:mechanosensitive ion channel family protein [Litoreibacter janthinus]|uniref:Small-conductance mechanosensitive channel n=1 Tax=Litoreibacter janthinus TaxID=670154 RepID=A0A1I6FWL5_9RHOB|nr:mechanosensitive ion channel family protein [Litoreibacter janthinus]SFR34352.1 small conductance mechanosensitive channel [Litoreibacter janthinus]